MISGRRKDHRRLGSVGVGRGGSPKWELVRSGPIGSEQGTGRRKIGEREERKKERGKRKIFGFLGFRIPFIYFSRIFWNEVSFLRILNHNFDF